MKKEILNNEVEDLMHGESMSIRREKEDLDSAKNIINKLIAEGELELSSTVREALIKIVAEGKKLDI